MRQGFIAAAIFAAGLIGLSPAQAATTSATTGPKIAVVDLNAVIENSQRGREATQSLQDEVGKLQAEAKDKNDKRKAYKDQLDKSNSKSADYKKLLKQFQDADADFQNYVNESRQLIEQRRQEALQPIQQELGTVITQFVKDNNVDILLSKNPGGAIFSADAYDMTAALTAAMDKDWAALQKAQQAAPTPAPAAATKGH